MRTRGRNLSIQRGEVRPILSQRLLINRTTANVGQAASSPASEGVVAGLHGLAMDPQQRTVEWRGKSVQLSYASYKILHLLAARYPDPVPKLEIARHLGLRSSTDLGANARNYVSHLRLELRRAGLEGLVHSEPWIGYSLDCGAGTCASRGPP